VIAKADHIEEKDGHLVILFGVSPVRQKSAANLNREPIPCTDLSQFLGEPIAASPLSQ
jgi:hypothetical protein